MKYAIGEIVLVVIGILIALQINNWNEHNKKKQDERILLMAVLENLELDSVSLASLVHNQARILDVHKKLIGITKGSNTSEDIENLGLLRRSLPNRLTLKSNYPELPNQVLDETVKSAVLNYYQVQYGFDFTTNMYNNILEEYLVPICSFSRCVGRGGRDGRQHLGVRRAPHAVPLQPERGQVHEGLLLRRRARVWEAGAAN